MDNDLLATPPLSSIALESESRKGLEYDRSNILGRGGFAIVYGGTLNGKPVAVKRIQLDMVANENKREEEALRRLDHSNVIDLLHVEDDDDFK